MMYFYNSEMIWQPVFDYLHFVCVCVSKKSILLSKDLENVAKNTLSHMPENFRSNDLAKLVLL